MPNVWINRLIVENPHNSMGKKLRAIPKFASWEKEEEDEFWSGHSLTDLDLEEDSTPLVIERGALRYVKKIEIPNPISVRPWKRKTA